MLIQYGITEIHAATYTEEHTYAHTHTQVCAHE